MTPKEKLELVRSEIRRLSLVPMILNPHQILQLLKAVDSPEADDAIRVFALLREWPEMQCDVRLLVILRLFCAAEWYEEMQDHDADDFERISEELVSVTTAYWRDGGRDRMFASVFRLSWPQE